MYLYLLVSVDEDAEEEEDGKLNYNKLIMPDVMVCLEATDEFLRHRVMNLPETVVAGTHNTEEGLMRRLADYRKDNTEDETVLNYFDELEIHPYKIGEHTVIFCWTIQYVFVARVMPCFITHPILFF